MNSFKRIAAASKMTTAIFAFRNGSTQNTVDGGYRANDPRKLDNCYYGEVSYVQEFGM